MTWAWRALVLLLLLANIWMLVESELSGDRQPRPNPVSPTDVEPAAKQPGDQSAWDQAEYEGPCFMLGPLENRVQLGQAEDRLRPFVEQMRTRTTQADRDLGWWVFVPAPDRAGAIEIGRKLGEQGLEDFYVLADASLPEAVSVGVYDRREAALARRERLKRMGFDARMEIRRERVTHHWIDYRLRPGARSPWRTILRASPIARQLVIPCFDS